jgi:membrane associated rhomboid family serine protease
VLTWGGVAAVPAVFMLGLWILLQFVNGFGSIAVTPETGEGASGGVAYLAHIGGFIAGMILAPLLGLGAGQRSPTYRELYRVGEAGGWHHPQGLGVPVKTG